MIALDLPSFSDTRAHLIELMRSAPAVKTERWQGIDVRGNPAATSYELMNVFLSVDLLGVESLDHWRSDIAPNLPWADDHFLERIGGEPLNPGTQWANWPWAPSADKFRSNKKFNHTYMERLWGKYARRTDGGMLFTGPRKTDIRKYPDKDPRPRFGAGWQYGDLQDLVELLANEPHTRQACIPLFWPEDVGVADGGRKPCTMHYQVLVRDDAAHMFYPLRSCDLVRHWADDAYLAVRLLIWIIDRCRERSVAWGSVRPGALTMHMTSLHIFENDKRDL